LAEHKAWYEEKVGAVAPDLYVFPFGDCRKYEPERPISSFKKKVISGGFLKKDGTMMTISTLVTS